MSGRQKTGWFLSVTIVVAVLIYALRHWELVTVGVVEVLEELL